MHTRILTTLTLVFVLASAALAGCVDESTTQSAGSPRGFSDGGSEFGQLVAGRVMSDEFLPIKGAKVVLVDYDLEVLTDESGDFLIGPVNGTGKVEVAAQRLGYATAVVVVELGTREALSISFVLEQIPGKQPYHETVPHTALIECAVAGSIAVGTTPCNPIDRNLGIHTGLDNSQWFFDITSPNLVAMLQESVWEAQTLGRDMRFLLLIPDILGSNYATGSPILDGRGGSPFRAWLFEGEPGDRGSADFITEEGTPYQALYRPWTTNSTTGYFAAYVYHRVDNFYTFFYHEAGPRNFSVLPDE